MLANKNFVPLLVVVLLDKNRYVKSYYKNVEFLLSFLVSKYVYGS